MLQPDTALIGGQIGEGRGRIGLGVARRRAWFRRFVSVGFSRSVLASRARGGIVGLLLVSGRWPACWPPPLMIRRPASPPPPLHFSSPLVPPSCPRRCAPSRLPLPRRLAVPSRSVLAPSPRAPNPSPIFAPHQGRIGLEQRAFPPPKPPSSVKKPK